MSERDWCDDDYDMDSDDREYPHCKECGRYVLNINELSECPYCGAKVISNDKSDKETD